MKFITRYVIGDPMRQPCWGCTESPIFAHRAGLTGKDQLGEFVKVGTLETRCEFHETHAEDQPDPLDFDPIGAQLASMDQMDLMEGGVRVAQPSGYWW